MVNSQFTIGLVYNLREDYLKLGYTEEETAEFDTIESLGALIDSLTRLRYSVVKIGHAKDLTKQLVAGKKWDLVVSMAEGLNGRNREAQVPAILELYEQPYALSDALTMAVTLDKGVAKRLVRDSGVPTADFLVLETGNEDLRTWEHYPAFVKPVAEGTSKGCDLTSKVHDENTLRNSAKALINRFKQPVLLEAFLPGREFTVGITGSGDTAKVLGVSEITMNDGADPEIFSLRNKENQDLLCTFRKVTDIEAQRVAELGLVAYRALGCRDCCRIDFRSDNKGNPHFLEANAIPGMHPANSDLPVLANLHDFTYDDLVNKIIVSARHRYTI